LAVGEKPPATPTKLHREHHRHRDNRNNRTEAAGRRSTERDDQRSKLDHQCCSSQDDAFSKGNGVASPPPSGERTRDFSHAAEWWCRVVLQRGLQEGERRRWRRPRHGQQRRPWVSPVPAPTPPHLPNAKIRRPKTPGARKDRGASRSSSATFRSGDRDLLRALHPPPPRRPRDHERGEHAPRPPPAAEPTPSTPPGAAAPAYQVPAGAAAGRTPSHRPPSTSAGIAELERETGGRRPPRTTGARRRPAPRAAAFATYSSVNLNASGLEHLEICS
jgi:hypothetical protein